VPARICEGKGQVSTRDTNVVESTDTRSVPDESFSVVSFNDLKPTVVCEGVCRANNTEAQLLAIGSGGLTPLYDSIVFTSRMLARRGRARGDGPHVKKIVILFSDGADTVSLNSFTDAMESALDNDVAIYSVDVSRQPHSSPGAIVLSSFSSNTGGRYFPIEVGMSNVLDAILEDFHAAYTVTYKLPIRAAGFHLVRILPTHNLSLQFHCRLGYYYPSSPGN